MGNESHFVFEITYNFEKEVVELWVLCPVILHRQEFEINRSHQSDTPREVFDFMFRNNCLNTGLQMDLSVCGIKEHMVWKLFWILGVIWILDQGAIRSIQIKITVKKRCNDVLGIPIVSLIGSHFIAILLGKRIYVAKWLIIDPQ